MILRLCAICLCLALFHGVISSDDVEENVVEERQQTDLVNENEQLSGDLTEPQQMQIDYSNVTVNVNDTANSNSTNVNNSTVQISCLKSPIPVQPVEVQVVNSAHLASILQTEANITSRRTPANCVAVLFYSPSCPFSCVAFPPFYALPWFFPDIKMVAIDALIHRNFNAQYGIFGIPTLILFHNGRPAARLNQTSYCNLGLFLKFIQNNTNLEPTNVKLEAIYNSFVEPVILSPVNERDYYLLLAWGVIILQLLYSFYRSSWGRWLVDATLSAWREAEAQHHHID